MVKEGTKTRSFRIVRVSNDEQSVYPNVYTGRGPGQAALKAFNWYCRANKLKTCKRSFVIEEVTENSAHKQFPYIGFRTRLDKPKENTRGGDSYKINYDTTIKADWGKR